MGNLYEEKSIGAMAQVQRYITFVPQTPVDEDEIAGFYRQLAGRMQNDGQYIVWEKAYGSLTFRPRLERIRRQCLDGEHRRHPITYLEGKPIKGDGLSGVVFYTISSPVTRYFAHRGTSTAVEYTVDASRRVYFSSGAADMPEEKTVSLREQFVKGAGRWEETMRAAGMPCNHLVRTWFYLSYIDRDYSLFNTLRRELFDRVGVDYTPSANELPASTCIGAKSPFADCELEFLCCDKQSAQLSRVYNPDQNEADGAHYRYHPTFSRALLVCTKHFRELQISGTASIGPQGDSMHCENPEEQIRRTLRGVGNLLHNAGMDYGDIVTATCFFKRAEDARLFSTLVREMNIASFPHVPVVGDVCRKELLFELDGIALQVHPAADGQ